MCAANFECTPWPLFGSRGITAVDTQSPVVELSAALDVNEDATLISGLIVLSAPLGQSAQHRPQLSSLGGQDVLRTAAAVRNRSAEQPFFDEVRKPLSQDCFRDLEVIVEVGEPSDAVKRVAQNEECPAFADDLQRPGYRAGLGGIIAR